MKLILIQTAIITLFIFSSCERLVEIDPPQDQLISETVFESNETATSAISGLYASMMKSDYPMSYSIALYTGLCTDELDYRQTSATLLAVYQYGMNSKDALTNSIWTNAFNYIYQANSLIEGLNKSSSVSDAIKNQLVGEGLFIRAFWNYYLINLYGNIPLVLTTNYDKNSKLTKSSVESVRTQIIKDLIQAKTLLSEKYVGPNSTAESTERIRPNTLTASALLARLYLEMNNYSGAEEEATRVISNNKYELPDLTAVFKRTSKEVIWQLELPTQTNFTNSYESNYFTLLAKPNPSTTLRCSTISNPLLSLFNQKDKRRAGWIGTFTDNAISPAVRYNFPAKYKTRVAPADEYSTPFRLAEMFLVRAEARAQLGLINDAINDTDKIRVRAGLDPLKTLTPNIQKTGLLDSIANERQRELFCEWGLRWFDIKRSTITEDLMKIIAAQKGVNWKQSARVWPIPLNDVLNSGNKIEQNEGYN